MDDHIFCEYCCEYVYEYCSIHGPFYVIPDAKPPTTLSCLKNVPLAALTIPREFLHIARSTIPGAGLGVFATLTLPRDVRFGPYQGLQTKEVKSSYCWQIYDLKNKRPLHFVDAGDSSQSNWMRYVNCARHWTEQNLVAFQYQGNIYYKTLKIVPRFSELLVYYGTESASSRGVDLKHYNARVPDLKSGTSLFDNNNVQDEKELMITKNTPAPSIREVLPDLNQTSTYYDTFADLKIKCNECNKEFDSKNDLIEHLKTHDNGVSRSVINNSLNEQNVQAHPDPMQMDQSKPHICSICKQTYALKKSLRKHYKIHFEKENLTCLICLKILSEKRSLRDHILHVHVLLKLRCHICKGLYKLSTIKDHVKTQHLKERKMFPCQVCSKQYCNRWRLKEHVETVHLQKHQVFYCTVCSKQYYRKSSLKNHMAAIHVEERKMFTCPIVNCKKQFYTKGGMKEHMEAIHVEERKMFTCPIVNCKKQFYTKGGMKEHMEAIHVEERTMFTCPIANCKKQFYTKRGMREHMEAIHVEERKMFTCPIPNCKKQFYTKGGMKEHMEAIHVEERKMFTCPIVNCKKQFYTKGGMREHMEAIHVEERKMFTCPIANCKKQFYTKGGMKEHMEAIHVEERKMFTCPVVNCSLQFYTSSGMKKHINTIHVKERK